MTKNFKKWVYAYTMAGAISIATYAGLYLYEHYMGGTPSDTRFTTNLAIIALILALRKPI